MAPSKTTTAAGATNNSTNIDSNTKNNTLNAKTNIITANDDANDNVDATANNSDTDQSALDTDTTRTGTAAVVIVVALVAIVLVVLGLLYRRKDMQIMLPEDPDVHIAGNKAFENPQYGDAPQGYGRRASRGSTIAATLAAARHVSTHNIITAAARANSNSSGSGGGNVGQPLYRPVYDLTGGSGSGANRGGSSSYYTRGGGNSSAVVYSTPADFSPRADYAGVSYEHAGTASANTTQLYAIPMEGAATDNTGAGVDAINLPRSAVGTVILDAASGAYEVVSATNGIYAPTTRPETSNRFNHDAEA